mgnify:CR=1 FL=1
MTSFASNKKQYEENKYGTTDSGMESISSEIPGDDRKILCKRGKHKGVQGFSGEYGSYAQKGGETSMLRLRMPGGRLTKEKLKFIADMVEQYHVDKAHFTTCQAVQLHDLDKDSVCDIMEKRWMSVLSPRAAAEIFREM